MVRPCRVRLDTSGYRSSATRQASITCVPSTVCSTCRGRAFLFCIGLSRLHPWPDVGGVLTDFWTSTTRPFHPPALGHLPRCSPHASAAPTVCASTRRGRAFLFCIGLSRLHPWPDVGGVLTDFWAPLKGCPFVLCVCVCLLGFGSHRSIFIVQWEAIDLCCGRCTTTLDIFAWVYCRC